MKMNASELLQVLKEKFGDQIDDRFYLPKAFWLGEKEMVKAVYLGCDPTNTNKNIRFDFAFSHGCMDKGFVTFRKKHLKQLEAIGLSWKTVYTQNLCRNYFKTETSKNKIWKQAAEMWIDVFREELDELFSTDIPVLLTSQLLLDVLLKEEKRPDKYDALKFYDLTTPIPVPAVENKLERPLIPVYRGVNGLTRVSYQLNNFPDYIQKIREILPKG